ncbi:MAG: hypothetical protein SGBAC_002939 [Bacillariaceae sp.]
MKDIFVYTGDKQKVPKDIERAQIHPSVKVIKKEAFACCTKLKYVQFSPSGLEEIAEGAFRYCNSLESVRLSSTTRIIHKTAFQNCDRLRYVILNEGLQMIGHESFDHCASMEFLALPSTMRHIQGRAFRYCSGLVNALFNDGLVEVGTNAFQFCTALKEVIVPRPCTTKFCHGSKKWINQWPMKDDQLWNLVSSNADHADKAIMAKYGMLALDMNGEYTMMPLPQEVRNLKELLETFQLEAKKKQQDLQAALGKSQVLVKKKQREYDAALESWKKSYGCLEGRYRSLQSAYHQAAQREEDASRRLHALTSYYQYYIMTGVVPQAPSQPNTSTAFVPIMPSITASKPRDASSSTSSQENGPVSGGSGKGVQLNKRKSPMQDSTNQVKKLRPLC